MTFIYRHEAFRPCSPRSLRRRLGAFFDSCQWYDEPSTLFSTNTTHEFWSYIWSILSCKTWVFLAATAECEACIPFDGACIDFWCVNACERRYETREGGCVGKYQCQCHIASDYYCSLHLKPCDIGQNLDGRHYWSFYICWSRAGDDIYVDHHQEEILYPCSICNNLVFFVTIIHNIYYINVLSSRGRAYSFVLYFDKIKKLLQMISHRDYNWLSLAMYRYRDNNKSWITNQLARFWNWILDKLPYIQYSSLFTYFFFEVTQNWHKWTKHYWLILGLSKLRNKNLLIKSKLNFMNFNEKNG